MNAIFRRLTLLFSQGLTRFVGHAKIQARVFANETLPNIDRIEPYGFSYRPRAGSQAYLFFPSGDRTHGMAIVIGDRQYNMELTEGEVALHDDEGNYVHLARGGAIKVKSAGSVEIDTPCMTIDANERVTINTPALEINAQTLAIKAAVSVEIASPQITLDAAMTTTTGALAVGQGLSVAGGGGASTMAGDFTVTGQLAIAGRIACNGKDIGEQHTHSGVLSGPGTTGPVA